MAEPTIPNLVNQVPALDQDGKFTGLPRSTMEPLFDGCLATGAAGLRELIGMLREVDDGSDYRARYVLHGLAVYVCTPDRTAQRALLCQVLAEAANGPLPAPVRGFLVRQLQVCGTAREVPALGRLLGDAELCETATQALLAIGEGAEAAFIDALERLPAARRGVLAQGLLCVAGEKALPTLRRLAGDADLEIRLAALLGLARRGDVASVDGLLKAADAQGYERTKAAAACVAMGEALIAAKHTAEAQRVYRYLYRSRTEPSERYLRDLAQKGLMAAGFTDPSAPTTPGAPTAEALDSHSVRVSWSPSEDPDSGIWQYAVSRDGQPLAVVHPGAAERLEFVDRTAQDGATYTYAIRAVNLGRTESAPAEVGLRFLDTVPPRLLTASCFAATADQVRLTFSKPMAAEAAQKTSAYALKPAAAIASATLAEDGTTLMLKTAAPLPKGAPYEVTAAGLTDRAVQANALAEPRATFTVIDQLPGIAYACYEEVLNDDLAAYDKAEPKKRGVTPKIDVSVRTRDDRFSLRFEGILRVPAEGEYTFYTTSDDGSRLYLDGQLVVDNGGLHGAEEKSGTVRLPAGGHAITVTFFEEGGGEVVTASWQGPGIAKQEIPPEVLFHVP